MKLILLLLALTACALAANPYDHLRASKKLTQLPGAPPGNLTSYSGYIQVNATYDANLFYWFFPSQSDPANDPILYFVSGGPGCSDELALFFEMGPYSINEDLSLKMNPYSWNMKANLIFIDQPVGTGFSYVNNGGYVHNEKQVGDEIYTFYQVFFSKLFPSYVKNPFFMSCESYGGHYCPAIAQRIDEGNYNGGAVHINLEGFAIGNGMTDPLIQYKSLAPYARSHGLIDITTEKMLDNQYAKCASVLNEGNKTAANTECNAILDIIGQKGGPFNVYDVTKTCPPSLPLCYNFTLLNDFLAQPQVLQELGVGNRTWEVCSGTVYSNIIGDWFNSERYVVPMLLDRYRVMVFNGRDGYICNFMGSEEWVRSMEWPGAAAFKAADRKVWMVDGDIAGYVVEAQGLSMVVVNNAGHMVPHDQPAASFDMINKFMRNQPF